MTSPIDEAMRDFGVTDRPIEIQIDPQNEERVNKITKIVDKWHKERYDTDWDFLQGSLMKIYKVIHK